MKRTPLKSGDKKLLSKSLLKSISSLKKGGTLKVHSKMRSVSDQQKLIDKSYRQIKHENFDEEMLCSGCKQTTNSTPSHLIPRSRRPDLIDHPKNIKPHCITCHPKWEGPNRVTLLDYEENMQVIKELDPEYYQLILMKQK